MKQSRVAESWMASSLTLLAMTCEISYVLSMQQDRRDREYE